MVPALFDKDITTPLIGSGVPNIFAESFRSIRTNVLFSSTDQGGRLVVITSSTPGEGKTVVSTNVAVALAQAGHRVLLIDADMRKPRVHEVFEAAADAGAFEPAGRQRDRFRGDPGVVDVGALDHAGGNASAEPGRTAWIEAVQGLCGVPDAVLRLGDHRHTTGHGRHRRVARREPRTRCAVCRRGRK